MILITIALALLLLQERAQQQRIDQLEQRIERIENNVQAERIQE